MSQTQTNPALTRVVLLPYVLAMVASSAIIQVVIAAQGNNITLLGALLTFALALGMAAFLIVRRRELRTIRFGFLVAHVGGFAPIVVGFTLHAMIVGIQLAETDPVLAASRLLNTPWFGVVYAMTAFWGMGLTIHLIASVSARGWER